MAMGRVLAVCGSMEAGMPRPPLDEGTLRVGEGLVGNHNSKGGQREVCLFEAEAYAALRDDGMVVRPGSVGENLTLEGIRFADLRPGDRLRVGAAAVLEITIPRTGCPRLRYIDARMPEAIEGRSGWMARVSVGGVVRPGDAVDVERAAE